MPSKNLVTCPDCGPDDAVAGAILTLGLSEALTHPVTAGKEYVVFEVFYDRNDRVERAHFISTP